METFCFAIWQILFWTLVAGCAGIVGLGVWGIVEGILIWKEKNKRN